MSSVALGAGAACAASSLYNLGLALQALDAREAPATDTLRPALLARLARRPRWLAGTALNLLGWPLQAAALLLAPLTVVQPSLAFGLVLLLVIGARRLGEPVGPREAAAVAAILAGVALLAIVAPEPSTSHARAATIALVLGVVGVAALTPYALLLARRGGGGAAALGAGFALAWSGLTTKLVADALHSGHVGALLAWAVATGAASGLGLLAEMSALQQRPATQVAPVVFVVQVLVPVAAGRWLAHEPLHQLPGVGLGIAAVVGGAVALLRSPVVRSLVDAEASSTDSETGRMPARERRLVSAAIARAAEAGPSSAVITTTSPADGNGAAAADDVDSRS